MHAPTHEPWRFRNPVDIRFGIGALGEFPALLAGRTYALVTYPDAAFTELSARLEALAGRPAVTINDVQANPDLSALIEQGKRLAGQPIEAIVALGGGSVIDTAKFLAASTALDAQTLAGALTNGTIPQDLAAAPIIAIPTTAGTGSEVTQWATVWDEASGRKLSLSHASLYPQVALVDPELALGKPAWLTVGTGLDALSHALESLWNRNANPVSAQFAASAARGILQTLPALARAPRDLDLRVAMARAALFAGLAFSNTKTAIAHSISSPITLKYGVQHGIACSFTLPMILRAVDVLPECSRAALSAIFGPVSASERMEHFMGELGVSTSYADYGIAADDWEAMVRSAFAGERGANYSGTLAPLLDMALR
jgi:alcohol dehydrogenase